MKGLEQYFSAEDEDQQDVEMDLYDDAITLESAKKDILSLESNLDLLLANFESYFEKIVEVQDLMKANQSPSLEQLSEINEKLDDLATTVGINRKTVSVESIVSVEDFYNVSMEEMTDFVGRFIQVFSNGFVGTYDAFHRVIRGRVKNAIHYKERIKEVKELWKNKKGNLKSKTVLSSYAGRDVYIAFRVNNRLNEKPAEILQKDQKNANEMIVGFTKKIDQYMKSMGSIIKSGNYSNEENFTKTVVKKIGDLGSTVNLVNSSLLVDKPILLTNVGWQIKSSKVKDKISNQKDYEKFHDVITERLITRDNQWKKNIINLDVFHDIELSYSDVESILNSLESYCDDIIWYGNEYEKIAKNNKDTIKFLTNIFRQSKKDLDKTTVKMFKQVLGYLKFLSKQQTRPVNWEMERVLFVLSRASIYIRRAVKRVD